MAIQEVIDNLAGLRAILGFPPEWPAVFSDAAGNDERAAFLYNQSLGRAASI